MAKLSSLNSDFEFKKLLKSKRINNIYFTIYFGKIYDTSQRDFKVSVVTKKKIGNAVKRNKIKRKLKSSIIKNMNKLKNTKKYGYLLLAGNKVYREKFSVINEEVDRSFTKINKIIN
jgi:ribonuclease P protein component